jgi:D-sorbitol dehydrogenase (acceptor)
MTHEGKVIIVTGASSGIGAGIAERLGNDGAQIALADIDVTGAGAVAGRIGDRARVVDCDVTSEESLQAAVDDTIKTFGRLDGIINNAGVLQISSALETSVKDWDRMFAINVRGMFLGTKVVAAALIEQGEGGSIVNAASGAGRHGVGYLSHYCATKASAISMTQSFALELADHNIRVNGYAPGHIMTPMWDNIWGPYGEKVGKTEDEIRELFLGTIPLGRWGDPADVAAGVSWLLTDDAGYITGQTLPINGGEWLH